MASYRRALTEGAEKEIHRLPKTIAARISGRIEKLAASPRPNGCKKLKGGVNEWRIRIGDYRVIYTIDDAAKAIDITRIAHRKGSTNHDRCRFGARGAPAASLPHERSTTGMSSPEATAFLQSVDVSHLVGLRDRAFIAVMVFAFARVWCNAPCP